MVCLLVMLMLVVMVVVVAVVIELRGVATHQTRVYEALAARRTEHAVYREATRLRVYEGLLLLLAPG